MNRNQEQEVVVVSVKLDKEEYYENEAITGQVRLKLARDLRDFQIRIELKYLEHYVLFSEDGNTALQSKSYKKKLIEHQMDCSDVYERGEHIIQFAVRMPSSIQNGTFYHSGETLSARITYIVCAKVIERVQAAHNNEDGEESGTAFKVYKGRSSLRVCNHFKYVTVQKVLYDETSVSRFMCFGGGVTNVEAEFVRDTFCVT